MKSQLLFFNVKRRKAPCRLLFPILLSWLGLSAYAADPFAEMVRKTEPLSPADELKALHVPDGFEVQLFAAEPDIAKPMNMAFDERGRLWVSESREYPYAAPKDRKGRDAIKILEDSDGDGRADKITMFAEGLNIPIGLYPFRGGVISFSIPHIFHFQDADRDGRSDQQEILYGPFGYEKDTHGMTSAFRRGFDGWLYACHGFNNTSSIRGKDGSSITMQSGNTYRMRVDGSRVEQFTYGQVNPFGLAFDPWGNLYSADCHSSPIYQLLAGAWYPSFGKPHDGLGFAPTMMNHTHNSTAIGGIVFYAADRFPKEFRNNLFVGNVMTSRINRDSLVDHGSTRLAKEESDFLRSDDPWFRPVDLQLGPDGAMYVADFYNRIIGHYEVPLDHPGRDRERGRIWRVTYRGKQAEPRQQSSRDWSQASLTDLIEALGDANLTTRMLVMNHLADSREEAAAAPLRNIFLGSTNGFQKAHALWVLQRMGRLDDRTITGAANDEDPLVRTHSIKALSITNATHLQLARKAINDTSAFVVRAAADYLGRVQRQEDLGLLLALRHRVSGEDTHLLHVVRMAVRNKLLVAQAAKSNNDPLARSEKRAVTYLEQLRFGELSEADARAIADVAVAIANEAAASFLLQYVQKYSEDRPIMARYLKHAVKYLPERELDSLAKMTRSKFGNDIDLQMELYQSVQEGLTQRGLKVTGLARDWGAELAEKGLNLSDEGAGGWHFKPTPGMAPTANPWFVQSRPSSDGVTAPFLCSLPPGGEQLTGILRSDPFVVPPELRFFLAGHDGLPGKGPQKRNVVRLRSADSDEIFKEQFPPRNDEAKAVHWDLQKHAGKKAYLEVVDGDNGSAYAWLALGRFDPAVVKVPELSPSQITRRRLMAAELAATVPLPHLEPKLVSLVSSPTTEVEVRAAAARALLIVKPNDELAALASLIADPLLPTVLLEEITAAVVTRGTGSTTAVLKDAIRIAPHRITLKLAQNLVATLNGAQTLLNLVEKGEASPFLLLDRTVREKLASSKVINAKTRVERLTAGLSPLDETRQKVIDQKRKAYGSGKASAVEGGRVFTQNCAACHQVDGAGGLVGPQMDGIGNRGLERLLEDVLDPNRNVDHAFRSSIIVLADGDVASGLFRRQEGELIVLADSTGKEISIPKKQIKEQRQSEVSLMPDNFGEVLSADDFNHLMAFLLSKSTSAKR